MTALFDLDDFEETRPEWVILGNWDRCGLCGTRVHGMNQGGTRTGIVCDDCAQIDSCRVRGPRHVSHWGMSHDIADHDRLVAGQARRRAAYLRKVAA